MLPSFPRFAPGPKEHSASEQLVLTDQNMLFASYTIFTTIPREGGGAIHLSEPLFSSSSTSRAPPRSLAVSVFHRTKRSLRYQTSHPNRPKRALCLLLHPFHNYYSRGGVGPPVCSSTYHVKLPMSATSYTLPVVFAGSIPCQVPYVHGGSEGYIAYCTGFDSSEPRDKRRSCRRSEDQICLAGRYLDGIGQIQDNGFV